MQVLSQVVLEIKEIKKKTIKFILPKNYNPNANFLWSMLNYKDNFFKRKKVNIQMEIICRTFLTVIVYKTIYSINGKKSVRIGNKIL